MIRRTLLFKFVSWFVLSPVLAAAPTHQTYPHQTYGRPAVSDILPRNELTGPLYAIRISPTPLPPNGRASQAEP
jgi:hypothetical protein